MALLLAVVGIFGVVSYVATQRTREIGVRMALGAQRREILTLVVSQGMRPIVVGIAIGVVTAIGVTRFMTKLLFQVAPLDLSLLGGDAFLRPSPYCVLDPGTTRHSR